MDIFCSRKSRLQYVLDMSLQIFIQRLCSGRISINKEASMQLHYSSIIHEFGELLCIEPKESFSIELEHNYKGKNIDIICGIEDEKAAIELKCFRKSSNRASDMDMYDVLKDITRLMSYESFCIRRFFCLTDNQYYINGKHEGHASVISIKNGTLYKQGGIIIPTWKDKWKDTSRNHDLTFDKDVSISWETQGGWYYLNIDV